jgi:phenylalanyl-tRNA synthetase alpha chain
MLTLIDTSVLEAIYDGCQNPDTIAKRIHAKRLKSEQLKLKAMRALTDEAVVDVVDVPEIKIESVRASADLLQEKRLINVFKSSDEIISLTEEGLQYAKEGLPERKLLKFIGTGKQMPEVRVPDFNIPFGWLRKKGWAIISGGMIKPAGDAPQGEDEKILFHLLNGPTSISQLDSKALAVLKSRNLIKSNTTKSWRYEITDEGKSSVESWREKFVSDAIYTDGTITQITSDLIKSGDWKGNFVEYNGANLLPKPYDVTLAADKIYPGKKHPYQRLIDFMREIMLEMGFVEIKGQIVQSSFWNFDALFQPQDHPAREMQDTFYLDSRAEIPDYSRVKEMHECGRGAESTGWGGIWSHDIARQEVLRTHTTGVTIKYLAEHPEPPVKAFGIDRVYRREAIDATHTPEFEQLEGIVMDRDVTFSHLLGILKEFYAKMGFEEVRFRPGYFPYTEPSVEPEVFIDGLGWVELGGAGVFRKEVTAPFGIEHPVLAWGLGVSRVAMLKLGLKDLRLLYQSDLEWLRQMPVSIKL